MLRLNSVHIFTAKDKIMYKETFVKFFQSRINVVNTLYLSPQYGFDHVTPRQYIIVAKSKYHYYEKLKTSRI